MSDLNKAILEGRLAGDPKTFNTENGKIVRFTVASTEHYKSGDEVKDRVQFNPVAVYDKYKAEYAEKNLHKGSHVLLEGAIESHSFVKDDETRYQTEVALRPGKAMLKCLDARAKEQPSADNRGDLRDVAGQRQQQQQAQQHNQ